MLKARTSCFIAFLLAGLIVLLCGTGALAAGGSGGGGGGGNGNPLELVSADPADGQKDVSLSPEITLTFSKNVVNMSVKDNNLKCFALSSADGTEVPVNVIMADDQIEPDKKEIIVVTPAAKLSPDSQYTLKILPDLSSKSGVTLGQTVSINFSTEKGAAANESTSGSPEPVTSEAVKADSDDNAVKEQTGQNGFNPLLTGLLIVVIIAVVLAYFKIKKR